MPSPAAPVPTEDMKAQLLRLKDLTRHTGALHEAQVLQLKTWPYLRFPLEQHEAHVEFDERCVTYLLKKKGKKLDVTKNDKASAKILESWVQSLLGDEWKVEVNMLVPPPKPKKGKKSKTAPKATVKTVYPGKRKAPFDPQAVPPPGGDFKRYGLQDKAAAAAAVVEQPLKPLLPEGT